MSSADVTNQPLAVQFTLAPRALTDLVTDNSQYHIQTLSYWIVKPHLSAMTQMQLSSLEPLLMTPLGMLIDKDWSQGKANLVTVSQTFIEQLAKKHNISISNVSLTLQDPGAITATVAPAPNPADGQNLWLEFTISGNEVTLDDPHLVNWKDDFDIAVQLYTPVPVTPFGFAAVLTATGEHAKVSPNNFLAEVAQGADNFFTGLWNWISGGNDISDVEADEKGLEIYTDSQLPTPDSSVVDTLNGLNSMSDEVQALGFSEFAFSIESGNVLTGTLTHPLDPAPVVVDVTHHEAGGGVGFLLPELSVSEAIVPPGGSFNTEGTNFPWATSGQLYLEWQNTATGKADTAQLMITTGGSSTPVPVPPGMNFTGQYVYTATGLQPNADYTFTARCADQVAWSLWSDPLKLTTSAGDLVQLMLVPPAGSPYPVQQIGSAGLASGSSDWACPATIPAAAPAGVYTLSAVLNAQTLATAQITVGAVTANIAVIDPATNQVIENPQINADAEFVVRGEAFPDGMVNLTIAGQPAGVSTSLNGHFIALLNADQGTYTSGTFIIAATGGGATATTTYYQVGKAK